MQVIESLEQKTLVYWNLSQVWNGIQNVEVQTGDAIEMCSSIESQLNPIRPLRRATSGLLREIIEGEGRKTSNTKVLPFVKPQQEAGATQ